MFLQCLKKWSLFTNQVTHNNIIIKIIDRYTLCSNTTDSYVLLHSHLPRDYL